MTAKEDSREFSFFLVPRLAMIERSDVGVRADANANAFCRPQRFRYDVLLP